MGNIKFLLIFIFNVTLTSPELNQLELSLLLLLLSAITQDLKYLENTGLLTNRQTYETDNTLTPLGKIHSFKSLLMKDWKRKTHMVNCTTDGWK